MRNKLSSPISVSVLFVMVMFSAALRPVHAASDLPFGRLFTTPEQRASLDRARLHGELTRPRVSGSDENAITTETVASQTNSQPLKLSGVLLRADGQHQVWVSGGSGRRESPDFNRKILGDILQSANVKVPLQGGNRDAILKPGQVWVPTSHSVEESYQRPVPTRVLAVEPDGKAQAKPKNSAVTSSTVQTSSTGVVGVSSSAQSSAK